MSQATPAIHVSGLRKRFRTVQALGGVSLDIQQGEFSACWAPRCGQDHADFDPGRAHPGRFGEAAILATM